MWCEHIMRIMCSGFFVVCRLRIRFGGAQAVKPSSIKMTNILFYKYISLHMASVDLNSGVDESGSPFDM